MQIEYEKDYLEELYDKGSCKNKKYRFQQSIVTKFQKRIDTLMAATRIEDLFVFNSLNFEALDNGYFSITIKDEQNTDTSWRCTERRTGSKRYLAKEILRTAGCNIQPTKRDTKRKTYRNHRLCTDGGSSTWH